MPANIYFLYFFWNLRYSIVVLKCFSRWHLIAKCIKFWSSERPNDMNEIYKKLTTIK